MKTKIHLLIHESKIIGYGIDIHKAKEAQRKANVIGDWITRKYTGSYIGYLGTQHPFYHERSS